MLHSAASILGLSDYRFAVLFDGCTLRFFLILRALNFDVGNPSTCILTYMALLIRSLALNNHALVFLYFSL